MGTEDSHLDEHSDGGRKPTRDWASLDDEAVDYGDVQGACLRPANKPIPRLHVVDKQGRVRTFCYVHMDSDSDFDGNSFRVQFATYRGLLDITVTGRNLWRMYDYVTLHRWPFLRADHRSEFKDGEVIESIDIDPVTPKADVRLQT